MLRLIERIDSDGLRVESGFVDDSALPEAPTSRPDAPDRDTPMDLIKLTGAIAAVVISTWLLVAAAAFVVMDRGGSDPCDSMRLSCSAPAP